MAADATRGTIFPAPTRASRQASYFIVGIGIWIGLIQISIAASQIVLAILLGLWIYRTVKGDGAWASLPIDAPLGLYAGLSLLAALFSFDPGFSLQASKKLLLLAVPYMLVSTVRRRADVETLVIVLIVVADIGALVGLWQYRFGELGDIDHRIRGFMGHYMTYSGLLMGVAVLGLSSLLFGARKLRLLVAASLLLILAALALTLTRSAWVGFLAASLVLVFLKDKRLLLVVPVIAVGAALILPRGVEQRIGSFWRPDTSGWDRLYMIESGAEMVANHPWLGVGPNVVAELYPIYRVPDAPMRDNPHLHNNFMQIAAERGVACALAWLWLIVASLAFSGRSYRRYAHDPRAKALAAGAIGVIIASFVAGIFEYNFGDSELQMLLLFVIAIPFMLDNEQSSEPGGATDVTPAPA